MDNTDIFREDDDYLPTPCEKSEEDDVIAKHIAKLKAPPHSVEQATLGIYINVFNVNPNMFNDNQVYYSNRKHFSIPADKLDACVDEIRKFIAAL